MMKNLVISFQKVLAVLAFILLCSSVFGQNLFDEMPTPVREETTEVTKKIRLRKENQFNKSVIKINLNKIRKIQKEDGKFNFKIPNDNSVYTAFPQYVEVEGDDNYQWNGEVIDKENTIGYVTLSEVAGALFGEIHINERSFVIEDFGKSKKSSKNGRISYLVEKDTERTKNFECATNDVEEGKQKIDTLTYILENAMESRMMCTNNVRVLVLFTTAANNVQNGNQAAVTFINQANQSLRNSGISEDQLTFQLAASQLFNGVDDQISIPDNDQSTTIGLSTAVGLRNALVINAQNIRANTFDADMVVLLTNSPAMNNEQIFGVAFLHNLNDRDRAHAIVQIEAPATRFSFVHELAHNFGCKHDNDDRTVEGLTTFARGKAWTQNGVNRRTIMALANNTERIQNFSNPNIYFNGISTGESGRDNARQLREQANKISQYEIGQDPAEVIISGPSSIFLTSTYTWCATSCTGLGITSYQWSWSPNGFTYYNFGDNNSCASKNGVSFSPSWASKFYVRVIATFSNGQTDQAVFPVTNRDRDYFNNPEVTHLLSKSNKAESSFGAWVFPNPTSDGIINIEVVLPTESKVSMSLFNETGRLEQLVLKDKIYPKGKFIESIKMDNRLKGIKYLQVSNGNKVEVLPIIIQ